MGVRETEFSTIFLLDLGIVSTVSKIPSVHTGGEQFYYCTTEVIVLNTNV